MHIRGFHHLAIQVQDVERVAAWYRQVLGLPEQARFHRPDGTIRSIWVTLPGGFLALEHTEDSPLSTAFRDPRPGLHLLSLRIGSASREPLLAQLKAQAVPIEHETRWTLYIRDPEGNRIGLSHHPDAGLP